MRLLRLGANAQIAALTSVRALAHDPVTFGMQVVRRFPSLGDGQLSALLKLLPSQTAELLSAWRAGEREALAESLHSAKNSSSGLDLIGAEIAIAAGYPDLVVDDERQRRLTRARAAWMLGEMRLAEEFAPRRSRYEGALHAERAIMTPGNRLRTGHLCPRKLQQPATGSGTILHVLTNSLPHTQSGYTLRSHSILLAQRDAGLTVEAITRAGYPVVIGGLQAKNVDVVDGVEYRRVLPATLASMPDQRLRQQVRAILARAAETDVSIVHTTTNYANGVVAQAVATELGIPWTYEVRGMQEQTWVATLASDEAQTRALQSERYRLIRAREAQLAEDADAVFTLSEGMRDDLTGRGVQPGAIHLAPNSINASRLEPPVADASRARAELGLATEGFWVGAVSSLVGYEGFDTLIAAVKEVRAGGLDVRVLLAGDGVARPELLTQAAELGEAAVFPGRVRLEDSQRYLAALDTVVIPRRDLDVTRSVAPLKPIEALAAGKPLLVSDLPPLVETIGPELTAEGTAVAPESSTALAAAIRRIALDDALRARLSTLGRDRAATRTWEALGTRYADVYRGLGS